MTPEMLQSVMTAHRLNAKKLAGLLSVSIRSVNHWLAGSRKITASHWKHVLLVTAKPKTLTISESDWHVE